MSFAFQHPQSRRFAVKRLAALGLRAFGVAAASLRSGRVRRLLCQVVPVWCLLMLGAGTASAMSASVPDVPAPMCDPDGASVAAGEDIPEVDRGHFESLPCEAQLLLASWRSDAPEFGAKAVSCHDAEPLAPALLPPPFRYEGACEFNVPFPERGESTPAVFSVREGLAPSRGHARGPFRPPLGRA